jgi:hypothetical protein
VVVGGVVGALFCLVCSQVERRDVLVAVAVAVACLPLILRDKRPVQQHGGA